MLRIDPHWFVGGADVGKPSGADDGGDTWVETPGVSYVTASYGLASDTVPNTVVQFADT